MVRHLMLLLTMLCVFYYFDLFFKIFSFFLEKKIYMFEKLLSSPLLPSISGTDR